MDTKEFLASIGSFLLILGGLLTGQPQQGEALLGGPSVIMPSQGGTGTSTRPIGAGQILVSDANRVYFPLPSTTFFVSTTAGRIGIGTNAPSSTAHIFSTVPTLRIQDSVNTGANTYLPKIDFTTFTNVVRARIDVNTTNVGALTISNFSGAPNDQIILNTGAANRFYVANSGNIGIASSSPRQLLSVTNTTYFDSNGALFITQAKTDAHTIGANGIFIKSIGSNGAGLLLSNAIVPDTSAWQFFAKAAGEGDFVIGRDAVRDNMVLGAARPSVFFPGVNAGVTLPNGTYSLLAAAGTDPLYVPIIARGATNQTADMFRMQDINSSTLSVFNSLGYLGISSSTPRAQLAVQASSSFDGILYASSSGALFIARPNGNIGINSSSPQNKLSIQEGNIVIKGGGGSFGYGGGAPTLGRLRLDQTDGVAAASVIEFYNGVNSMYWFLESNGSGNRGQIRTDNSNPIVLQSNQTSVGMVGVGALTPTAKLTVQPSASVLPFNVVSSTGNEMLRLDRDGNLAVGRRSTNLATVADSATRLHLVADGENQTYGGIFFVPQLNNSASAHAIEAPFAGGLQFGGGQNLGEAYDRAQFFFNQTGAYIKTGPGTVATTDRVIVHNDGRFGFFRTSTVDSFVISSTLSNLNPFAINSSTVAGGSMFRILTNGNVGINSSTPNFKLAVQSKNIADNLLGFSDAFGLNILSVTTGTVNILTDGRADTFIAQSVNIGNIVNNTALVIKQGAIVFQDSSNLATAMWDGGGITLGDGIGSSTSTYAQDNITIAKTAAKPDGFFRVNSSGAISASGTVMLPGIASSATGNAVCHTTTGQITDAGGGTCTPSALRTKEDIRPFAESAIEKIMRMNVVLAKYKKDIRHLDPNEEEDIISLIADELALIDNRLVDYDKDGNVNSINVMQIDALYAKAFQEQQVQIMSMQESIIRLENRVGIIERLFNFIKSLWNS